MVNKMVAKIKMYFSKKACNGMIDLYEKELKDLLYKRKYSFPSEQGELDELIILYEALIEKQNRKLAALNNNDTDVFIVKYTVKENGYAIIRRCRIEKRLIDDCTYKEAKRRIIEYIKETEKSDIVVLDLYDNKYIQLIYIIPDGLINTDISIVERSIFENMIVRRPI